MAKNLEQILGYVNLCGVIQASTTGVPKVLPEAFWNITTDVLGDEGRYVQVNGTRQTAKQGAYGSAHRKVDLKGISSKDAKLLHFNERIDLNPLLYQKLRQYDNYNVQTQGKEELARQISEFGARFENGKISAVMSMLCLGHVYYDVNGNLLPSSSGAVIDVDYGIPAGNIGGLNIDGGGNVIAASWATTSTDIATHLINLREKARRQHGYPLKYAFYGRNIPGYFAKNDTVKEYLARNPVKNQKYLDTGHLGDLFDFVWIPINESFFEDQNGSNQAFQGVDTVVFTPEIDRNVYEMLVGSIMVPTTFQPQTNLNAVDSYKIVQGMYSYAVPNHDPVTASIFMGDTFLPVWKNPNTLYIADATP